VIRHKHHFYSHFEPEPDILHSSSWEVIGEKNCVKMPILMWLETLVIIYMKVNSVVKVSETVVEIQVYSKSICHQNLSFFPL